MRNHETPQPQGLPDHLKPKDDGEREILRDYVVSLQMTKILPPDSPLYQWHKERLDYFEGKTTT